MKNLKKGIMAALLLASFAALCGCSTAKDVFGDPDAPCNASKSIMNSSYSSSCTGTPGSGFHGPVQSK